MPKFRRLNHAECLEWLTSHPEWQIDWIDSVDGLVGLKLKRSWQFSDFAIPLTCVMHLGLISEKFNHHPEIFVSWGKLHVEWTTHDSQGISELDLKLASITEEIIQKKLI